LKGTTLGFQARPDSRKHPEAADEPSGSSTSTWRPRWSLRKTSRRFREARNLSPPAPRPRRVRKQRPGQDLESRGGRPRGVFW